MEMLSPTYVKSPSGTFSFPNLGDQGGALPAGTYHHFRQFPAWVQPILDFINGTAVQGQPFNIPPEAIKTVGSRREYYQKVGALLARSYYATMRYEKSAFYGITLPFRTDIMPGSVIKLQKSDREDSYIGQHLYGMVGSTRISCDTMSEQPSLVTEVNLFALRDDIDNEKTESVTYDGNPLYRGRWVGMDLNGDLLSTLDNTDKPKPLVTPNYDTKKATVTPSPQSQSFNPAFPFIPQSLP
jgi:hypothetical protein